MQQARLNMTGKQAALVSVYIPTWNRLALLRRAIGTAQSQTYRNIELIVVDDGSTDGTREFLAGEMAAGALTAIFQEKRLGACAARNAAIVAAHGEFVTGLDDDDYFLSERRIEWFMESWKTAGPGVAGIFDSVKFNTSTGIIEAHQSAYANYRQLRRQNLVGNQVFAPRRHYVEAGLFDVEMPAWQDWDLWIRMSERFGTFVNLNRLTCMMDELHDSERIKHRDGQVIRAAMRRMSGKIGNISLAERGWLIAALHAYPQVRPEMTEIGTLMLAFRPRLTLRAIKKRLA